MGKEELTDKVSEFMGFITESLQQGKDFAMEQTPLIVQELILSKRIELTTYMVLLVCGMIACVFLAFPLFKKCKEGINENNINVIMAHAVPVGCLALFCLPTALTQLDDLIQVWFAPRVFILEYITKMI